MTANFEHAARLAYQQFANPTTPFLGSIDGWQIGCAFDTLTDYRRLLKSRGQDDPAENARLLDLVFSVWSRAAVQGELCWYDDHCWWGIAAAKAWDPEFAFLFWNEQQKQAFQGIALACWAMVQHGTAVAPITPQSPKDCPTIGNTFVHRGAPAAWTNREGAGTAGDAFNQAEKWAVPRFAGGVWQYDLYYTPRGACDRSSGPPNTDPCDPSIKGLGPFQDTVMNSLYLLFALRLHTAAATAEPNDPIYALGQELRKAVEAEYGFLQTWFDFLGGNLPADQSLLQRLGEGILVRERVSSYAPIPGGTDWPPVRDYDPANAWGGDQGLLLASLATHCPEFAEPLAGEEAIALLKGVAQGLTIGNVLQGTSPQWTIGDLSDYASGIGIFWRGLLAAWHTDDTVRKEVARTYGPILTASAHAVAQQSGGTDFWPQFNLLATLTAFLAIAPQEGS